MIPGLHPLIQHPEKQPVCISSWCYRLQDVIAFGSLQYLAVGCRFEPSWVPHRQFLSSPLPWQQSAPCFSRFCFCGKTIVKGLCAYPGCGLPAAKAGAPNPCLPSLLVAQYSLKKEPKFALCTSALSQSTAVLSLVKCLETSFTTFSNLPSPVTPDRSNVTRGCPKLRVCSPIYWGCAPDLPVKSMTMAIKHLACYLCTENPTIALSNLSAEQHNKGIRVS